MKGPNKRSERKLVAGGTAGGGRETGRVSFRPERLSEWDEAAILALMAKGRLSIDAANQPWSPARPSRIESGLQFAVGAAVWALAAIGVWSLVV